MFHRLTTAAGLVLALTAAVATAGPLPIWAYRVTPGPELLHPNFAGEAFLRGGGMGPGNQGWLDFHTTSGSGLCGAQVIRLAGLGTREYVTTGSAGTTIPFNDPYSLTLSLQNGMTGQVGDVTISGQVSGYFTADEMKLTSVFLGPASQELTLGDTRYVVSAAKFVAPNAPEGAGGGRFNGGEVDVLVTPWPADGTGPPVNTPEPTTLALGGIGLAVALLRRVARRRLTLPFTGPTNTEV